MVHPIGADSLEINRRAIRERLRLQFSQLQLGERTERQATLASRVRELFCDQSELLGRALRGSAGGEHQAGGVMRGSQEILRWPARQKILVQSKRSGFPLEVCFFPTRSLPETLLGYVEFSQIAGLRLGVRPIRRRKDQCAGSIHLEP